MLRQRVIVAVILLPIGLALIYLGGWAFAAMVMLILGLAAWEYARIFKAGGHKPADVLVISGAVLLSLGRAWNGFESADWLISLLILASMTYHLIDYERGRDQAASDFAITLSGILYFGWLGAYLISLRNLPNGMWWVLICGWHEMNPHPPLLKEEPRLHLPQDLCKKRMGMRKKNDYHV